VQARRRPGGSDLAIIGQGSQADLSLPHGCGALATKAQQHGPRYGLGFRKDEWDCTGRDESRLKGNLTQTNERRLWRQKTSTDVGAWGRTEGAQGALIQPE